MSGLSDNPVERLWLLKAAEASSIVHNCTLLLLLL
jgi:hypothetical protein